MALDALIATAKPRLLASVRRQATAQTIGSLIRTSGVWELMKARGIRSTGHNVVVYWDEPGRDLMHSPGGIAVDIGAEIETPFESDADLQCTSTPAGRFITVLHIGPVDQLGEAYAALHAHIRAQNLKPTGPYWEYYGHWSEDASKFETSVSHAIA
jgi:effector-binding domain-containing protein